MSLRTTDDFADRVREHEQPVALSVDAPLDASLFAFRSSRCWFSGSSLRGGAARTSSQRARDYSHERYSIDWFIAEKPDLPTKLYSSYYDTQQEHIVINPMKASTHFATFSFKVEA